MNLSYTILLYFIVHIYDSVHTHMKNYWYTIYIDLLTTDKIKWNDNEYAFSLIYKWTFIFEKKVTWNKKILI